MPTPTISPDRRAPAEQTLLAMVQAYQLSQSIYVAAKLGVPDVLAAGPQTPEAIAVAVGARAPELRRVLRALVAAGIFTELQDGRFELDDAGDALLADAPGRLRDITINFGEEMYRCFGELLHTVRTGQTAFEHIYGQQLFDYYAEHPEAEASGSARMLARSLPVARELAATDLLSGVGTVVDVGGGPGTVIAELLKHDPRLSAVLLERPSVLGIAHHHLSRNGMADRCRLTEGDFFESVPPGGDVYLLKSVLHDWNDERCLAILNNCRAAMDEDARLLIVELILPEQMTAGPQTMHAAFLDLIMLAYAGGRERTKAEFGRLLEQAGLRLERATALVSGPHVLEAAPA